MSNEHDNNNIKLITKTSPIVLVDGIGEFTDGSDCYEVLVKERCRGAYQYTIEFNFGSGYFRIEEPVRIQDQGKQQPFIFTIMKISKIIREIVYEPEPYVPSTPLVKQNPIKTLSDMASMQIVGVKPLTQHVIPNMVEMEFDPAIEDEVLVIMIVDKYHLTGHEYDVRKEISRMRAVY